MKKRPFQETDDTNIHSFKKAKSCRSEEYQDNALDRARITRGLLFWDHQSCWIEMKMRTSLPLSSVFLSRVRPLVLLNWTGTWSLAKACIQHFFPSLFQMQHLAMHFTGGKFHLEFTSQSFPMVFADSTITILWWIDLLHRPDGCCPCIALQHGCVLYWYDPRGYFAETGVFWKALTDFVTPLKLIVIKNPGTGCYTRSLTSSSSKRFVLLGNVGLKRAWCSLFIHSAFSTRGTVITPTYLTQIEQQLSQIPSESLSALIHTYTSHLLFTFLRNTWHGLTIPSIENCITLNIQVPHVKQVFIHSFSLSTKLQDALMYFSKEYETFRKMTLEPPYYVLCTRDYTPLHSPWLDLLDLPLYAYCSYRLLDEKKQLGLEAIATDLMDIQRIDLSRIDLRFMTSKDMEQHFSMRACIQGKPQVLRGNSLSTLNISTPCQARVSWNLPSLQTMIQKQVIVATDTKTQIKVGFLIGWLIKQLVNEHFCIEQVLQNGTFMVGPSVPPYPP